MYPNKKDDLSESEDPPLDPCIPSWNLGIHPLRYVLYLVAELLGTQHYVPRCGQGESVTALALLGRDPASPLLRNMLRPSIPHAPHAGEALRPHFLTSFVCAARENRTPISSLARTRSTTKPWPRLAILAELTGENQTPISRDAKRLARLMTSSISSPATTGAGLSNPHATHR